ncbi:hypothetical protein HPB50_014776 [Hyalomma asiaticum]|uniref:Uncharacterized protein n=1 Tax=Hyalomma asiaticum TaxID=266040 RepID=A0ACB7T7Z8_HYAAI|nr:hypothetical protein HPB50_014776 [Hyalomma asiaticum]
MLASYIDQLRIDRPRLGCPANQGYRREVTPVGYGPPRSLAQFYRTIPFPQEIEKTSLSQYRSTQECATMYFR